ncbi:hypothetical protein DPMN_160730 [Dreissena polymorpha]|uniref:Uncharacterized protein n=1 Tax=Dreissena polymorpha TaxID=45954 RepID=A0A9D4IQE8_DREPO|nr:hypothetical protein DPMN_160730 [Dreissena polymorpha]
MYSSSLDRAMIYIQPIVTQRQGIADGPHRRSSSAPWSVPCEGAMDVNGLPCCTLKHCTTPTTHYDKTTEG